MKKLKARVIALAGSRYIVGDHIADVKRVCGRLSELGYSLTVCYWDGLPDRADEIILRYEEALEAITGRASYLSVKSNGPQLFRSAVRACCQPGDAVAFRCHGRGRSGPDLHTDRTTQGRPWLYLAGTMAAQRCGRGSCGRDGTGRSHLQGPVQE